MSSSSLQIEPQAELLSQLIGTWSLLSYTIYLASNIGDEATGIHPYGPHVTGFITYTNEGYMSMHFCNPGQPPHRSTMPTESSEAELAESARRYIAYAGPFSVTTNKEGQVVVVHQAEVSLYPNWMGTTQRRLVKVENGGETLALWPETPLILNVSCVCPLTTVTRGNWDDAIDLSMVF
ncbi:hypothetical protein MMC30_007373 [Trapelia coarctata]|nr:hypothetical protein [Trapelia coarctata]